MSKRWRTVDEEAFETFGALLRQSCSRAVDRLSMSRRQASVLGNPDNKPAAARNYNNNNNSNKNEEGENQKVSIKPIDILVIQFCMYYFNVQSFPEKHYIRLAAEIVTGCVERVLSPAVFAMHPASLASLCESLVLENTAAEMQSTIKVIEEFVEAREGVSAWLEEEGGEEGEAVEMGAVVYASTEFWLRVHSFCVALSLEVAQGTSVDLRGRYEQELMEVLHALTTGRSSWGKGKHPSTAVENTRKEEESTKSEVKKEPTEDIVGDSLEEEEKGTDALPPEREALPSAVLGDTLALSHCPQALDALATNDKVPLEELRRQLSGIDGNFYAMVHARLGVMVARHWLARFGTRSVCVPPPLNSMQQRTMEEVQARRAAAPEVTNASGMPLDFIPDDHYYAEQLEQDEATLGEDEELYKEEVLDYYLHRAPQAAAAQSSAAASNVPQATMRRPQQAPRNGGVLLKPHHYAKVKEGFTWSQYNRTHYTKADPPPRKILWYEFTLRYPLLADTKRDMRRIFRIEDIPNKPEYCLLVFSVGPPYADVVYRIVRKQWDTRPGGVRTSFDSTGRYKLFFRFANTNYRR